MTRELHIVYATDSGYLLPTVVSAGSAIAHSLQRQLLHIHILDCGIKTDEWFRFEDTLRKRFGTDFSLIRHFVDVRKYEGLLSWHGSLGLYARFEIPEVLGDVESVLAREINWKRVNERVERFRILSREWLRHKLSKD